MSIETRPLRDDLGFGARIRGLGLDALREEAVRGQLKTLFEARGLLVFEDVEPSTRMQIALSDVFGTLKDIPPEIAELMDADALPGVIEIHHDPEDPGIVEIDGQPLSQWLPWHFDHCHNDQLWRAAVLRPIVIPPAGGLTGFADGIAMYRALSPDLRAKIEGKNIVYTLDVLYEHMRFGKPPNFREIKIAPANFSPSAYSKKLPRALHPAVWTRPSGEKVLHVSHWMAVGIQHHENAEGDALLERLCREMISAGTIYYHRWKPTDMLVWDNWRMLHSVTGTAPESERRMHRTTITGDYGLGRFETESERAAAPPQ